MYSIIVGATGGIGSAIAFNLASIGKELYLIGRNREKLENLYTEITTKQPNLNVKKQELDLLNLEDVKNQLNLMNEENIQIDSFIYAAGVSIGGDIFELSEKDWDHDLIVNLKVPYLFSQFSARKMKEQKYGNIITISSYSGLTGARKPNYSASKSGIIGLTRSISKSCSKYNICANCILPGAVNTELIKDWNQEKLQSVINSIPTAKLCEPQDIANLVKFLLLEESRYITGAVLNLTGGLYI